MKLNDKILDDVETRLSFSTRPIYEKEDVNLVMIGLRKHTPAWIRQRRALFQNPGIIAESKRLIDAAKERV